MGLFFRSISLILLLATFTLSTPSSALEPPAQDRSVIVIVDDRYSWVDRDIDFNGWLSTQISERLSTQVNVKKYNVITTGGQVMSEAFLPISTENKSAAQNQIHTFLNEIIKDSGDPLMTDLLKSLPIAVKARGVTDIVIISDAHALTPNTRLMIDQNLHALSKFHVRIHLIKLVSRYMKKTGIHYEPRDVVKMARYYRSNFDAVKVAEAFPKSAILRRNTRKIEKEMPAAFQNILTFKDRLTNSAWDAIHWQMLATLSHGSSVDIRDYETLVKSKGNITWAP